MSSVPLPTETNALTALERLREEVARLRAGQVTRDELIGAGLTAVGANGRLITSSALLEPVYTTILGMDARVSGAAAAVERLEARTGQIDNGFEAVSQRVTRLDTELRIVGRDRNGLETKINAASSAQQDLLSRVFAAEDRVEAVSKSVTRLFGQVQIDAGMASELGEGINATVEAVDELRTSIEANDEKIELISESITLLRADLDIANSTIEGLDGRVTANGEAQAQLSTRITATEGGIEIITGDLTTLTSRLTAAEGGITGVSTAVDSLTSTVQSQGSELIAQAESITNIRAEVGSGFTADFGFEFVTNHQGFTTSGANLDMWPATSWDGATVINATTNDPNFISPSIVLNGTNHPVVRALVRRRNNAAWDGTLYWSKGGSGFSAGRSAFAAAPPVGDFELVEWDMRTNADWRSGLIDRLRFDFAAAAGATIDIKWIVAGDYGQARVAQATSQLRVNVDGVSGRISAKHTVLLDVNGNISGTISENDGVRSVFSIYANVFRVIGQGAEGMEWQNGYLRVYGPGYQSLLGTNFGAAGEGLVKWFGPNVGASGATRANGTSWEAKDGTAYFAGQVLQGVLRKFESNTVVSQTAEVSTGAISSKNTPVALEGKFRYSSQQVYTQPNAQISLGGGATRANVELERRYRNANDTAWEGWVQLDAQVFAGTESVLNEVDGPSVVNWSISGTLLATDGASVRRREYRTRVTSISRRQHSAANPGNVPQGTFTQYQSIESME